MKKNNIVVKLKKDIKKYEKALKLRPFYNTKNIIIKTMIRYGLIIDYALPYIVSGFIISNITNEFFDNVPFKKDMVYRKISVETIDSSYGYHSEKETVDFKYNEKSIEYSTAWYINQDGLYERKVTTYNINHNIDLNNTELIFSLSDDELKRTFRINNTKTITKERLEQGDEIYSENALFIINSYTSNNGRLRLENDKENYSFSLIYLILVLISGFELGLVSRMFIKSPIRNGLKELDAIYQPISKDDIEYIKKVIALKKENLSLFDSNLNEEENNFQLRKK